LLQGWALDAFALAASQHRGSQALSRRDLVLRPHFEVMQPEDPAILVKLVQLAPLVGGSVLLLVGETATHDERRLTSPDGHE
jgi:hypothetical protein